MTTNGPNISVVLAFDHELSLGGTSDYERNLFAPTRELLALADDVRVPLVLFTDVLCGIAHERWDVPSFTGPYRASLQHAIEAGHDVQLHLHPHWLSSRFEHGRFVPSHDFSLAHFRSAAPPNDIEGIVGQGVAYLRDLGRSADANYLCVAFRAGGYNLAPETPRILRALYDHGIRIDSSIIKGFRFSSRISRIDFTGATKRANWFVPLDGPVTASAENGLFEVPIAAAPRTPVNNLPFLVKRVVHRARRYHDGGRGIHDGATSRIEKFKRLFPTSAWPLSFDNYADGPDDAFDVLRAHVDAHRSDPQIICATVSHPKSMGPHARSVMRGFIARARAAYGDRLEFVTFRDVYRRYLEFPNPSGEPVLAPA